MKAHRPEKTNAARLLDLLRLSYELVTYEVDLNDLSATSVALKIGLPAEQVFKTLLMETNTGEHLFAVIPGNADLDLKKLAAVAHVKKVELAPLKHVETQTGYVRGAVTVLAAKKPFPAYVDETLELYDLISVSIGQRGLQAVLTPDAYLQASRAIVCDLTRTKL